VLDLLAAAVVAVEVVVAAQAVVLVGLLAEAKGPSKHWLLLWSRLKNQLAELMTK